MKVAWLTFLVASVALGQSRATIVDAPLRLPLAMPEAEARALQRDFRQALAGNSAVLLPTRTQWLAAAADRKECDVSDACLQQLANAASSSYALGVSLKGNARTLLTATGRIVSQDGRVTRGPVTVTGVTTPLDVLKKLIVALELETLATSQPAPPPSAATIDQSDHPAPARSAAWITLSVAAAGAGLSLGFGLAAIDQLDGEQSRSANRFAALSLGTGLTAGAMLVTSIILFSISSPVVVGAVPTSSGGSVVVLGHF